MSVHVTSWAWAQRVGDPEAKLVLLKLADQANDEGRCWPSRKTIAEACEASVSTVQRRLTLLIELELLHVEPRYRGDGLQSSNCYIIPYRRFTVDPPGVQSDSPGGSPTDPPGGSRADPGGGSAVTRQEPSVEPSGDPSLNREREAIIRAIEEREQKELERLRLEPKALTDEENALRLEELRSELGL